MLKSDDYVRDINYFMVLKFILYYLQIVIFIFISNYYLVLVLPCISIDMIFSRAVSILQSETNFLNESQSSPSEQIAADTESNLKDKIVVETAVYCDEEMTKLLENAKADTVQKKVDYIISKFNGVS